jgi:hypothetical protein
MPTASAPDRSSLPNIGGAMTKGKETAPAASKNLLMILGEKLV